MDTREAKEIVAGVCRRHGELWTTDHFWERTVYDVKKGKGHAS